MLDVWQTEAFVRWFGGLRDGVARKRINDRLLLLEQGHLGDWKQFGRGGELRLDFGPGYRVYFTRRGATVILLLGGGDKDLQDRDIAAAAVAAETASPIDSDQGEEDGMT